MGTFAEDEPSSASTTQPAPLVYSTVPEEFQLPIDTPLGHPHIINLEHFDENTDCADLRIQDAIATLLYFINPVLVRMFFEITAPSFYITVEFAASRVVEVFRIDTSINVLFEKVVYECDIQKSGMCTRGFATVKGVWNHRVQNEESDRLIRDLARGILLTKKWEAPCRLWIDWESRDELLFKEKGEATDGKATSGHAVA